MTKEQWQAHNESEKNNPLHDRVTCKECNKRRQTKRANLRAKAIRSAYADCGMVRVRGNLGGIYYE